MVYQAKKKRAQNHFLKQHDPGRAIILNCGEAGCILHKYG